MDTELAAAPPDSTLPVFTTCDPAAGGGVGDYDDDWFGYECDGKCFVVE